MRWTILALLPGAQAFPGQLSNILNGTNLDLNRVLCPVLASLIRSGDLVVDQFGSSERAQIKTALEKGTGVNSDFSEFQSGGISNYDKIHKFDQNSRNRCAPGITLEGTACFTKRTAGYTGDSIKRWLNVFEMNGLETVEHGFSTGVRGGNCNSPPANDICGGVYPCEALFQKYYVSNADSRGRLYLDQIKRIICQALAEGDRGGEFSHQDGLVQVPLLPNKQLPARNWQMKAAMNGWLSAFGRPDERGELYFTVEDARAMLMESRFPDGWQIRQWGCITTLGGCPKMPNGQRDSTLLEQINQDLPCDQDAQWWDSKYSGNLQTITGQSCRKDSQCGDSHALCLSGRCTCSKGRNGIHMLFQGGACREQPDRMYMGKKCRFTRADFPDSPTTWSNVKNSSAVMV